VHVRPSLKLAHRASPDVGVAADEARVLAELVGAGDSDSSDMSSSDVDESQIHSQQDDALQMLLALAASDSAAGPALARTESADLGAATAFEESGLMSAAMARSQEPQAEPASPAAQAPPPVLDVLSPPVRRLFVPQWMNRTGGRAGPSVVAPAHDRRVVHARPQLSIQAYVRPVEETNIKEEECALAAAVSEDDVPSSQDVSNLIQAAAAAAAAAPATAESASPPQHQRTFMPSLAGRGYRPSPHILQLAAMLAKGTGSS
jgi:hypothetical protein